MDDDIIDYGPNTPNPRANTNKPEDPEDSLTPLEQEVLDEYAKLVGNLDDLSNVLSDLASKPSAEILDALRGLERKTTTVFTLLKASVYSIVLQQEIADGDGIGGE
ncbi:DASH complex subunit dad3 [Fulvia fulva]|uniref:DASH complex subunit DAD3 n=1 Tax=Passalora fulva TaxID=5499 RepID=A0A9Q8PEC4_PASFU|nr:DASH complex subunit dad3 [Fulvia fulva]KAK4617652.1 DASH complex subunit dad3 [Fulvia fulva]KAK4618907.1 DASH complex subunit dad3 [Fulvia fulva]UJO20908.1 DASH complex subunit dad3 [Fulvia fulva]WPV18592.1 DASH complex subunit dad3 [Fulvia fulva]WPV32954.1 DASH complex subunit dad3 [Fulvia fulva]